MCVCLYVCVWMHFYICKQNDKLRNESIKITGENKMPNSYFIVLDGDHWLFHQSPEALEASEDFWTTKERIKSLHLVFCSVMFSYVYKFCKLGMIEILWIQFSSVQSLSCVQLFVIPWIAARQASLSITISRCLPRLMSIESMMPSSHLILCRPLLLLPRSFPASGSFPMSQLFAWVGQSTGVSASASFLPKQSQG